MSMTVSGPPWVVEIPPVSGDGSDQRKLANWFSGGIDGRSVLFVGDSTTEQLAGLGHVAYAGGYLLGSIEPALIGRVNFKNRGLNGFSLSAFVSAGSGANSGGNGSKLDDICTELATLTRPLVVMCYGINDVRSDAAIASQAYGSAAHQTAANAIRANLAIACNRMLAANPLTSIILRAPNGMLPTSAVYLTNGVTGQNAMDVLRLAYRGDAAYGMAPIDELVGGNVALFDTYRQVYGDTAYAGFSLVDVDGLHPSNAGYQRTLAGLLRMISGPEATAMGTTKEREAATRYERSVGHGPNRPRHIDDIKKSGEWEQIGACTVVNNNASFFDLGFTGGTSVAAAAWGAAAGAAYGSAGQPQMGVGDVIIIEPDGLSPVLIPVGRMADSLTGNYVRWYSGGPDGYYPTTQTPIGSIGTIWRHKWLGSDTFRRNSAEVAAGLLRKAGAKANAYRAFVTSGSSGSLVLRGMGGYSTSLAAHTMSTSDTLCLTGVDDTASGGLALTGATFTGPDATTGALTISLAGRDFSKFAFKQAVVLSAT